MEQQLTETDKLKLEYLRRTSGLPEEARIRCTREFTELMQQDGEKALKQFVGTLPVLNA